MKFEGKGYEIYGQGSKGEIRIDGDIGDTFFSEQSVTATSFANGLSEIGEVDTLNVYINSRGGSWSDGLAITSTLARHPATVSVFVDSIAGSIASVIAMAGDSIEMAEGSFFFIHEAGGQFGQPQPASEHRKMADTLDALTAEIRDIYARKTGVSREKLSDMMAAETWINAADAVEMGFADSISKVKARKAAYGTVDIWAKAPAEAKALLETEPKDNGFGMQARAKLLKMKHTTGV